MPGQQEIRQEVRADKLEIAFSDASILHIRTTVDVYGRSADDEPELIVSRPDLDLLMDPVEQIRILRTDENAAQFDELAASARLIHIPITCHEHQIDPITDENIPAVLSFQASDHAQGCCFPTT